MQLKLHLWKCKQNLANLWKHSSLKATSQDIAALPSDNQKHRYISVSRWLFCEIRQKSRDKKAWENVFDVQAVVFMAVVMHGCSSQSNVHMSLGQEKEKETCCACQYSAICNANRYSCSVVWIPADLTSSSLSFCLLFSSTAALFCSSLCLCSSSLLHRSSTCFSYWSFALLSFSSICCSLAA